MSTIYNTLTQSSSYQISSNQLESLHRLTLDPRQVKWVQFDPIVAIHAIKAHDKERSCLAVIELEHVDLRN